MQPIKYRPDVDGLRAIAVLGVIIFHLNSSWLPGGFIGVDVFFVISGFIITTAIYAHMQCQAFSFAEFYIKRIKRILPLFYLVVFCSLLFAYLLYLPEDFARFADSMRYASVFIANVYFEKNSGYFAPSSEVLPLLHIWSLSVEEQFYFIWPVTLLLLVKFFDFKKVLTLVLLGFSALVICSQYFALNDPDAAYFLLHNRMFEMLAGAIVAIWCDFQRRKAVRISAISYQLLGCLGGISLLIMFWLYNEHLSFPGVTALGVVVAASFVILSGERKDSFTFRLLSNSKLVFVGKLSYSLYLWHWPIIAFYNYYFVSMSASGAVVCLALTFLLSFLSWRFFENPLRYKKMKFRWVVLFYLIVPIALTVTLAKNIAKNEGYIWRFEPELIEFAQSQTREFSSYSADYVKNDEYQPFSSEVLGLQNSTGKISVFLWGDSHAAHYRSSVDVLGNHLGFSALYGGKGGCPPLLGAVLHYNEDLEQNCKSLNDDLSEVIKKTDADFVFLGARWAMYTETSMKLGEIGPIYISDENDMSQSVENSRRVFEVSLDRTVKFITEQGKTPILLEQVAEFSFTPKTCWLRQFEYGGVTGKGCDSPSSEYDLRQQYYHSVFERLKEKYPSLFVLKVKDLQCSDSSCKSMLKGVPLYSDNNHLNHLGAKALIESYIESVEYKKLQALFNK